MAREPIELCNCIPGHRVAWESGICIDCGLTEQEACDTGNRPCGGERE